MDFDQNFKTEKIILYTIKLYFYKSERNKMLNKMHSKIEAYRVFISEKTGKNYQIFTQKRYNKTDDKRAYFLTLLKPVL